MPKVSKPASHRARPLTQSCRSPGPPLTQHTAPHGTSMAPSTPQGPGSKARAEHGPREAAEGGVVQCRLGAPRVAGIPRPLFGVEPVPGSVNRVKMILFFLKERLTGKDVVTYRFLLVFTSGSSLPSSELDPSLGSAERKSGWYGQDRAHSFGKPPASTSSSRLSLKLGKRISLKDGPQSSNYAGGLPLKMDLSPVTTITILGASLKDGPPPYNCTLLPYFSRREICAALVYRKVISSCWPWRGCQTLQKGGRGSAST